MSGIDQAARQRASSSSVVLSIIISTGPAGHFWHSRRLIAVLVIQARASTGGDESFSLTRSRLRALEHKNRSWRFAQSVCRLATRLAREAASKSASQSAGNWREETRRQEATASLWHRCEHANKQVNFTQFACGALSPGQLPEP